MTARKILLINGPNLDMLGVREPDVYGSETLATLEQTVRIHAERLGATLSCFQSNSEGKLIVKIHEAEGEYDGIVYNPGAHTHYSYALRDAIAAISVPVVEVHPSDVDAREPFRRISVIAPVCVAQVKGLGVNGYCRAVDVLVENDGLPRLGEDYEKCFAPNANVRIAGQEGVRIDESDVIEMDEETAMDDGNELAFEITQPEPIAYVEAAIPVVAAEGSYGVNVDLTEPFVQAVSEIDAKELSVRRQAIVCAACEQLGISALLVRDTSNIHWITNLDGVFDEERAHALLVAPNRTSLHTDSRYSNAIRTASANMESNILVDEMRVNHFQFARQELAPGVDGSFEGQLGIEDTITYAEFVKAANVFTTAHLVPTSNVVLSLRSVKDRGEITRLRAAQAIADAAFEYIVAIMHPGMTEREVQLELEGFMLRHGADGLAFGTIVACGENGADPHARPSQKMLEAGQCVVLDFGARAFGYCSDMTRVVFLGQPEDKMARAWEVVRQANESVEQMLRPGVTGAAAHNLAERVLAEGGFAGAMGHGLGHGVGLDCHELPLLNATNENPLVEGNVVTVEPGIYLPGEFGMRLEDCGVISADGFEVFSRLGHDMVVI